MDSPPNRPSLYGYKRRSMVNSARHSNDGRKASGPSPAGQSSNASRKSRQMGDGSDAEVVIADGDGSQDMTTRDVKNFNRYLKDGG